MRMDLTHDEKMEMLSIVKTWKREQVSQDRLRSIQKETGIPARSIEIMFWHYDTLSLFIDIDSFVFKRGTCVQSWLPSGLQRASVDLDFNSRAGNPNTIRDVIAEVNGIAGSDGRVVMIRGIDFGSVVFKYIDEKTGTMTFVRRMPTRFNEMIRIGEGTIPGIEQRIQINYKNSWLPAINPVTKEPEFVILGYEKPLSRTVVIHSSIEDLIADKILATCNVHGFGRERFKDVYDLGMILYRDREDDLVARKLSMIAQKKGVFPQSFIEGSVEMISGISEMSQSAKGFASMVGTEGRGKIYSNWETFCFDVIEKIRSINKKVNRVGLMNKMDVVENSDKDDLLDVEGND